MPSSLQPGDQPVAVGPVAGHVRVQLVVGLRSNAAVAACWDSAGGQMVKLPVRQSTARSSRSGTSSQPSRQPVIAKYLENELTTMASRENCHAEVGASSPYGMPW